MTKTTRLHMRSDDAFDTRIEDWRATFRVGGKIPPMAQAVRILVEYALEHMPAAQKGHDAPAPLGKTKEPPEPTPAPIVSTMPAKAARKRRRPKRVVVTVPRTPVRYSPQQAARRDLKKRLTAQGAAWTAYREERGLKVDKMSWAQCLEAATYFGIEV